MKSVKDVQRKEYYIFSPFLRIFHWIMVVAILVLFGTGLLITKPMLASSTEPTFTMMSMDLVRDIHFLVAFIFQDSGRDISTAKQLKLHFTTCY